ncbi:hypothetical protein ACHQM5_001223 [Ranunculus cassubicifolius]
MYNDRHHYPEFEKVYRCNPISSLQNKQHLENGDKVLLPPSALDSLQNLNVEFPMLFELRNPKNDRVSHCGVMEFTAEEGFINMPRWMMGNINTEDGDCVLVKNVTLPKAMFVKLQPHSKEFLNISNPKAVLEKTLRNYTCLTTGDTIELAYNGKKYFVDIIETKPYNAVSLYETDCEVDFAPPLDYVEPVKQPAKVVPLEPVVEELVTKLASFTGVARRLDGKPCSLLESSSSSTVAKSVRPVTTSRPGKLVFGSSADAEARKPAPKAAAKDKAEDANKEEKKWQAFTGKSYSLKG